MGTLIDGMPVLLMDYVRAIYLYDRGVRSAWVSYQSMVQPTPGVKRALKLVELEREQPNYEI